MRFYDALQLGPEILKKKIKEEEFPPKRRMLYLAMITRALLIVILATALIGPVGPVFGPENSCMAVVIFCLILGIHFVDFGYCMSDSLIFLGVSFLILLICPILASSSGPIAAGLIHFISVFLLMAISSDRPEMGNGGLFSFAYILMVGNAVHGELFYKRAVLALIGYILCSFIYYKSHKNKNKGVRFFHLAAKFDLSSAKCRWQLQMALGVSLLFALGSTLNIERMMWAGFACASMLGCYMGNITLKVRERFFQRIFGVILGSAIFYVVFKSLPAKFHFILGPLGGIFLGLCTEYKYKTAMNCLGALMLATSVYGLEYSVLLRILNNFLGAAFGFVFTLIYEKLINQRFESK